MTQDSFVKRHSYYKKAFKKSRWIRAKQRMFNRDPEWKKSMDEMDQWFKQLDHETVKSYQEQGEGEIII